MPRGRDGEVCSRFFTCLGRHWFVSKDVFDLGPTQMPLRDFLFLYSFLGLLQQIQWCFDVFCLLGLPKESIFQSYLKQNPWWSPKLPADDHVNDINEMMCLLTVAAMTTMNYENEQNNIKPYKTFEY